MTTSAYVELCHELLTERFGPISQVRRERPRRPSDRPREELMENPAGRVDTRPV